MENNVFWAFLAVSFIAGLTLGIAIYGVSAGITGKAMFIPSRPRPGISCNDTDGGINLAVKGSCFDSYGNRTEVCASPVDLIEYWCMNGTNVSYCVSKTYNCRDYGYVGCYNGACVGNASTQRTSVSEVQVEPGVGKTFSSGPPSVEAPALPSYVTTPTAASHLPHCSSTNDFILEDQHGIFHLLKCDRAIFIQGNRRKEITLHGVYVDNNGNALAHIQFKDFQGNTLCLEEDVVTAVTDVGYAVEAIEIISRAIPGKFVQIAVVTIPDRAFEEYCYSVDPSPLGTVNKKYVISDDEISCPSAGYQCAPEIP